MPTYVYECSTCKSTFEVTQRITEDALTECPQGHEGTVKRLIQPIAVMFKGSGFHINDYSASTATKPSEEANETSPAPSDDAKSATPEATPVTASVTPADTP